MKNHVKIEKVATRLLDFDYSDKFANEEIVKAIYFNRSYNLKDKKYFNAILSDFQESSIQEKTKKAIYKYLMGIYEKHNGNDEISDEFIAESFALDPNLKSTYPEFFTKSN
jgi:hypothetical protein